MSETTETKTANHPEDELASSQDVPEENTPNTPEGDRRCENAEIPQDGKEINKESEDVDEDITTSSDQERIIALQTELEQVKAKADDYYAHLQRLQAEFDNYRKRTQREKEELVIYASERLVANLLPVLDNFERAVAAAESSQDLPAYARGVEMIYKQFKDVLGKEGLSPIECVGQPFDPQCHEAVLQVDAEGYPENTVVEELQKGYYLKNKLLRPSMVKVSR